MGWGNPSPNGLLLEDQFMEVDYGGVIGKWWVRPLGKIKAETLEKPVDEMLAVACSRSPDVDDETYRQSLPSIRLRRSTKKNQRVLARLSFCDKKRPSSRRCFLTSTTKCPIERTTPYASDPVPGEQTATTKNRLSQETIPRLNRTLLGNAQ